ncbi:hypothetical protein J7T55_004637 [Diaporthe amygdali]|uniref:uncharacterized protein n=1 Tax=Phomopsis amygdali TaxID=1214568 RepID=UPI0022FE047D|nr:uncharacterized protein J7T55_004637 [Diaporthe amygdali]KAJ0114895.1 hypothetical protein J7T55_004637 [Diaporthe amygdali]
MASLPPGWRADYDGARWFYVYGPTGQSQFQFPRPGDEFPDFGGGFLPPAVDLMPEESLRARGPRPMDQGERCVDDVSSELLLESITDATKGLTDDTSSVPFTRQGEHVQSESPPSRAVHSIKKLSILSEPVLAVLETTAPSIGHQDQDQLATVAQLSPTELPVLDSRVIKSTKPPLRAHHVGSISELYSESTALCEYEVNPPPVELPDNERASVARAMVSNLGIQSPVELPVHEGPNTNPEEGSSTAGLGSTPCAPWKMVKNHKNAPNDGLTEALGAIGAGHDRAGLPSQASRICSEIPLDETLFCKIVSSTTCIEISESDRGKPDEMVGTQKKDLTHFPSILRPGPRRSSQAPSQQTQPVTNIGRTVPARLATSREHVQKQQDEADSVPHGGPVRMPTMPFMPHPHDTPSTAVTPCPDTARGGGARHDRLPGSVNFVIPIRHLPRDEAHDSAPVAAETTCPPKYHVSASFASATSSGIPSKTAGTPGISNLGPRPAGRNEQGHINDSSSNSLLSERTGSWNRPAHEADPSHIARAATEVAEWSCGFAR